jgi:Flp pilus assembly protein TadB
VKTHLFFSSLHLSLSLSLHSLSLSLVFFSKQGKLKRVEGALEDEKNSANERKKQVIAHVSGLNEDKKKLTAQLGRAKQLLEVLILLSPSLLFLSIIIYSWHEISLSLSLSLFLYGSRSPARSHASPLSFFRFFFLLFFILYSVFQIGSATKRKGVERCT